MFISLSRSKSTLADRNDLGEPFAGGSILASQPQPRSQTCTPYSSRAHRYLLRTARNGGRLAAIILLAASLSVVGTSTPMAIAGEAVSEAPESIVGLVTLLEENYFLKDVLASGEVVFEDKNYPQKEPTIHIRLVAGLEHGDIHVSKNMGSKTLWTHTLPKLDDEVSSYQEFIELLQAVANNPEEIKAYALGD